MEMEIKEEEWQAWMEHRVTGLLRQFLRQAQQGLMEQWRAGAFQGEGKEETYILESFARGEAMAYQRILELEFDQVNEVLKDE